MRKGGRGRGCRVSSLGACCSDLTTSAQLGRYHSLTRGTSGSWGSVRRLSRRPVSPECALEDSWSTEPGPGVPADPQWRGWVCRQPLGAVLGSLPPQAQTQQTSPGTPPTLTVTPSCVLSCGNLPPHLHTLSPRPATSECHTELCWLLGLPPPAASGPLLATTTLHPGPHTSAHLSRQHVPCYPERVSLVCGLLGCG